MELPLVWEPSFELADGRGGEVGEQLREVALGVDAVAAAGAGEGQWVYDAFGNVVSYDQLHPHEQVKAGHKGLFADRIDAGLATLSPTTGELEDTPVLVPFSDLRYVVRNRTLHPQLGRWQQRDPNGTGQPVLASLSYHGEPTFASPSGFSLGSHFGDGLNTHEYVGGDPVNNSDPSGLFVGGLVHGAMTGLQMASSSLGQMQDALRNVGILLMTDAMVRNYAVLQSVDADWATDWSIDDEGSTHSQSFSRGVGVWQDPDDDECFTQSDDLVIAAAMRLGPNQSRQVYEARRSQWTNVRRQVWKAEYHRVSKLNNSGGWTKADLQRMERGLAPDGVTIHHRRLLAHGGTNNRKNLYMMLTVGHRGHYKALHSPPYRLPVPASPVVPRPGLPRIRLR